jgi:pentatricopeptide repeat protein
MPTEPSTRALTPPPSLRTVCKSIGSAERAFKYFADMKADNMKLDGQVYGALVAACAEAMQREVSVVHERKDQYVLLERAFGLVDEAEATGMQPGVPTYNALLVCTGRSGQLGRAFQVLDMMTARGVTPDALTYGSLIEACVQANRQELAFKIFNNALREVCARLWGREGGGEAARWGEAGRGGRGCLWACLCAGCRVHMGRGHAGI